MDSITMKEFDAHPNARIIGRAAYLMYPLRIVPVRVICNADETTKDEARQTPFDALVEPSRDWTAEAKMAGERR